MIARSIDSLREEHEGILRAIEVLKAITGRVKSGDPVPSGHSRILLDYFRTIADLEHHTKEESILFPSLVRAGILSYDSQVRAVLFEHNQGRSLVEGLEDATLRSDAADFVVFAEAFIDLMTEHISKEEGVLFPIARQLLEAAEDDRIMDGFTRADREFGAERQRQFEAAIRNLERTYLAPG